MKALAVGRKDYGRYMSLVAEMHRMRRRIFKDRLDWEVSVTGDMEVDRYDALGPEYLLLVDNDGPLIGSVRFLPTTGPNMLADTFSALLDGEPAPASPTLPESSRFCVDTARTASLGEGGLRKATFGMFAAMVEWGLLARADAIVTVTDVVMERVLRRAGWPLSRLSDPKQFGSATAVAGTLEVSWSAHSRLVEAGQLPPTLLARDEGSAAA